MSLLNGSSWRLRIAGNSLPTRRHGVQCRQSLPLPRGPEKHLPNPALALRLIDILWLIDIPPTPIFTVTLPCVSLSLCLPPPLSDKADVIPDQPDLLSACFCLNHTLLPCPPFLGEGMNWGDTVPSSTGTFCRKGRGWKSAVVRSLLLEATAGEGNRTSPEHPGGGSPYP